MNSTSLVIYKPLVQAIDFKGNKYYFECSIQELEHTMDTKERIYSEFSGRGVKVSNISEYWIADSHTVEVEWRLKDFTELERSFFEASIEVYHKDKWFKCPLTSRLIDIFIMLAKSKRTFVPMHIYEEELKAFYWPDFTY